MDPLQELKKHLQTRAAALGDYWIPSVWNGVGYKPLREDVARPGEISIDPIAFYLSCIEWIESQDPPKAWVEPLSSHALYSLLPRCLTAWDHLEKDIIESGSFLKTICLLPRIRALGADILYLLPVFDHSERYRKASLGSPYALRDFYALAAEQFDPLLGEFDKDLLDLSFAALVAACHKLGMKLVLDFAFRSSGRDNLLIRDHPDWFYWIDASRQAEFRPIDVADLPKNAPTNLENIEKLYASDALEEYVSFFRFDPRSSDPDGFADLLRNTPSKEDLLAAIEEKYGLTTAPAYSDVINDIQPLWTDATYLRLDLGRSEIASRHLKDGTAPIILNDGMKMSVAPAGKLNDELCEYLCGIIPYYQQRFGIDGARIDMGHALPRSLHTEILFRARSLNPDFLLWSEVFHAADSSQAADDGFDLISGSIWDGFLHRANADYDEKFLADILADALPPLSALETPDTPRAAISFPDIDEYKNLILLSVLLPAALPQINAGMEIYERQPMNLGLGNSENWQAILPENDPMHGKLAFFDLYRLHWTQDDKGIGEQIRRSLALRKEFIDLICDKTCFSNKIPTTAQHSQTHLHYEKNGNRLDVYWQRDINQPIQLYTHEGDEMLLRYDGVFLETPRLVRAGETLKGRVLVLTR